VGTVSEPRALRALVVGAVSCDLTAGEDGREAGRPGGVVVHAGRALARLGVITRVVTRVRRDDAARLLAPLESEGVAVLALPSAETTTYVNDYAGPVDRHELRAASDPIRPEDVAAAWREADLVQLGPLHGTDVLAETAAVLRGFRGLDLQGLVRATPRGGVQLAPFLAHVEVAQASEHELPAVLAGEPLERFVARHALREMIVTRGARGATIIVSGRAHDVAAYPVAGGTAVGAGDVFLAVYLLLRVRGADPLAAADGAARLTALRIAHGEVPRDAKATLGAT
jgi:sugar/nucleoside kinase (ribokinase family)